MFRKKSDSSTVSSSRTENSRATDVCSVISIDMQICGGLKSTGRIHIDGHVESDVQADSITIGQTGVVIGNVRANSIKVLGRLQGDVACKSVTFGKTAEVHGVVMHEVVEIEAGAKMSITLRQQSYDSSIEANEAPQRTVLKIASDMSSDPDSREESQGPVAVVDAQAA